MGASDKSVIRAVLNGDTAAYRALVVEHSAMVFRVAYRITQNEADADEVVQEAFFRGYQKLASFHQDAAFGSWIYRIAVNCAYDLTNRYRTEVGRDRSQRVDGDGNSTGPGDELVDTAADPERLLLSSEMGAQQMFALHSLTPLERAAFLLRHVEEQSTTEIAAALNIAPNAAKQAVFRAVQKLRRRLASANTSKRRHHRGRGIHESS
ncbi:RNA polymerase sigma factor [Acidicapsa ligni]|uniref:RNA polymerase sigma factor n=1 Tax=Acidicapsa ligni TaxID=542300 RepID=UPI0021E0DDEA|nr:RNA polymerase sigma factor [Acidicapsa ligni]